MKLLQQIQNYFDQMDQKQFYRAIGIFVGTIFILLIGLTYYYHRKIGNIQQELQAVNKQREQVKQILERAQKVKLKRSTVDAMLAEDENFKISGYFENLLKSLGLWEEHTPMPQPSRVSSDQAYGETTLTAQLVDITMKDLTKLLEAIEQKKRIYTKELDITTSKKTPKTIDVSLTIATLQPVEQPKSTTPAGE